jgi:hypothetical protein
MKSISIVVLVLLALPADDSTAIEVTVAAEPSMINPPRVGVNLGLWTSWGAEQLSANVLKNPGFEGSLDAGIVIVSEVGEQSYLDDTDWISRPEGFWDGARYEILSGALAGQSGTVEHSSTLKGRSLYRTSRQTQQLKTGDAISVSIERDGNVPTQWWLNASSSAGDLSEKRPESLGRQSLRLEAKTNTASVFSYIDAIGERAGKLLPMRGDWVFSVWAKSAQANQRMRVRLHRAGSKAMLDETVSLRNEWREFRWIFPVTDDGPPGTLEMQIEAVDIGSIVWLDDASLHSGANDGTGFRLEVVETLRTLRPGYLRDWQGQLGDTFENRFAPAMARRTSSYRPGGKDTTDFFYGVEDFLRLSRQVEAMPWIVLPTTWSETEWRKAGQFLHNALLEYQFREVLVEFGNENWNAIFRPAAIGSAQTLTTVAARAFAALEQGAEGDRRIRPVVGGQFYNPGQIETLRQTIPHQSIVAVAPYWAFELNTQADLFPDSVLPALRQMQDRHPTAIYEVNAHSLGGQLTPDERNQILESNDTGGAMVWNTIGALLAGIRQICVYSFSGFDTPGERQGQLVRLFGITRDLAQANHFRPAGAALVQLNDAVNGDLHPGRSSSPKIRLVAFRNKSGWTVVAASRSNQPETVRVQLPGRSAGIVEMQVAAFGFSIAKKDFKSDDR